MNGDLLGAIIGIAFLGFLFYKTHDYKHNRISRKCPACGYEKVPAGTSLARDLRSNSIIYNYKCPSCGYKFTR